MGYRGGGGWVRSTSLISDTILLYTTKHHKAAFTAFGKTVGSVSCRGMRIGDTPVNNSYSSISIELAKLKYYWLHPMWLLHPKGYTAVVLQVAPVAHQLASKTTLNKQRRGSNIHAGRWLSMEIKRIEGGRDRVRAMFFK